MAPEEWLRAPEDRGFRVRMGLSREQVLRTSADGLREKISETFVTVFPLFVLASQDDPSDIFDPPEEDETQPNEEYSLAQCAADTGFSEELLARWVRAIHRKGQAIFSGPPGTGKTFVAQHIGKHLVGGGFGVIGPRGILLSAYEQIVNAEASFYQGHLFETGSIPEIAE